MLMEHFRFRKNTPNPHSNAPESSSESEPSLSSGDEVSQVQRRRSENDMETLKDSIQFNEMKTGLPEEEIITHHNESISRENSSNITVPDNEDDYFLEDSGSPPIFDFQPEHGNSDTFMNELNKTKYNNDIMMNDERVKWLK